MSTEVITGPTQDFLMQEHAAQWRFNKLSCMKPKGIRTKVFSPIPNINMKFRFEIWYQEINVIVEKNRSRKVSSFKVVLVKLFASEIQPSLKLQFEVAVNYTDGTLFKEYKSLSGISVDEMNFVNCMDDVSDIANQFGSHSSHGLHMQSDALILKLRMRLFGHLSTPSVYCHEMCSLNNLKKFVKDFSAIWKPSVLSDIIIRIGEKDLPAHRVVLAAHSPVFMKMMESDCLESKTNSITISDFKYDIFESFLKYLYSGGIEDKSWSNVRELYILADKYDVQALKGECAEIIASFLTVDQVCEILMFTYDYNDSELKEKVKYFAVTHFHEIVRRAEWYALVISHPTVIREVMASVYLDPKKDLENKEPVTLEYGSNEIMSVEE